jgi:hypothetical protein
MFDEGSFSIDRDRSKEGIPKDLPLRFKRNTRWVSVTGIALRHAREGSLRGEEEVFGYIDRKMGILGELQIRLDRLASGERTPLSAVPLINFREKAVRLPHVNGDELEGELDSLVGFLPKDREGRLVRWQRHLFLEGANIDHLIAQDLIGSRVKLAFRAQLINLPDGLYKLYRFLPICVLKEKGSDEDMVSISLLVADEDMASKYCRSHGYPDYRDSTVWKMPPGMEEDDLRRYLREIKRLREMEE